MLTLVRLGAERKGRSEMCDEDSGDRAVSGGERGEEERREEERREEEREVKSQRKREREGR